MPVTGMRSLPAPAIPTSICSIISTPLNFYTSHTLAFFFYELLCFFLPHGLCTHYFIELESPLFSLSILHHLIHSFIFFTSQLKQHWLTEIYAYLLYMYNRDTYKFYNKRVTFITFLIIFNIYLPSYNRNTTRSTSISVLIRTQIPEPKIFFISFVLLVLVLCFYTSVISF